MATTKVKKRNPQTLSKKGEDRVREILEAARNTLIEYGYSGFTMRKIAEKAEMAPGNITYYYKTKEEILHDLLDWVTVTYESSWDRILGDGSKSDEEKLFLICENLMLDLGERSTTYFFPELWTLSNHDEQAASFMNRSYGRERVRFKGLISKINPDLSPEAVDHVALFISASIEGHTPFIGFNKEYARARKSMARFAARNFVEMVKQATDEEVLSAQLAG